MKTSTPVRINLALGLGALMVLLVAALAFNTIDDLLVSAQRSLQIQQTSTMLEQTGRRLAVAESAQRKFLFETTEDNLIDYESALARAVLALSRLQSLQEVEETEKLLTALAGSVDTRLGTLDQAVRVRRTEGPQAASLVVNSDLNRQLKM